MKLDAELVRDILAQIENLPYDGGFHDIAVEGRSESEITYHVMILNEAGLIEAQNLSTMGGTSWKPKRLTYAGHQFLDTARSNKVWQEAKKWLLNATGTLSIEGLKMALPEVTKRFLQ